jgi:hypothetical protein
MVTSNAGGRIQPWLLALGRPLRLGSRGQLKSKLLELHSNRYSIVRSTKWKTQIYTNVRLHLMRAQCLAPLQFWIGRRRDRAGAESGLFFAGPVLFDNGAELFALNGFFF